MTFIKCDMKNRNLISVIWMFVITTHLAFSQKVVFLHHSTGRNVFTEGNVKALIDEYNKANHRSVEFTARIFPNTPWPWSNYPFDYWKLWIDGSCSSQNPNIECIQTLAKKYDMVIMKHCYPGSAIKPNTGKPDVTSETKTLENYKEQYRALRSLFDSFPDTKFMVWTLAPLHRMATTPEAAGRAREFVEWVKNDWLKEDNKPHPNIYIFDFFCHLAELDANPAQGVRYCLRYDFERDHSKGDSHPNLAANKHAGPLFVKAVTDAFYPAIIQP